MGRKYTDIIKKVDESASQFSKFLENILDEKVLHLIKSLTEETKVYIFSGVIRNFFLKIDAYRDIDIVLENEINIKSILKKHRYKVNSYGGYKIFINKTVIDIWFLKHTWGLKIQNIINHTLEEYIPHTAFFNFSAITYSLNDNKFSFHKSFIRFLKYKEIDYVFKPNANPALCIINTFYYSDNLNLKVSEKLMRFIIKNYWAYLKDYKNVQIKHFAKLLYSNDEIIKRANQMAEILENKRKRRKKKIINLPILPFTKKH